MTEGERLAALVDKLLDLSKLQAGGASPRREWVSIEEVVLAARGEPRTEVRDAAIRIVNVDPDLPEVHADAAQLERAFANLLENASRYSGGAPVSVNASLVGHRVVVSVVDHGPGDRRRPSASGSSSRSTAGRMAGRGALDRIGARAGDRQGVRRGQRRHDRGAVAARAGHELRRSRCRSCIARRRRRDPWPAPAAPA